MGESEGKPTKAAKVRLAETVAVEIEREIVSRGWPVGEVLGSETELIERFGVSRAIFREAVRIVEHHNAARMRRGPGGGLVVMAPDPKAVQKAAALYLTFAGVRTEQLFETRAALEIASAGKAAERIDEEGVAKLRAVLEQEEKLQEEAFGTEHPHDLHVVIGELSGNPATTLFVRVLTALTPQRERPDPKGDVASYHRAHEALAEAIIAGDAALAQHRMRRHLGAVSELLEVQPGDSEITVSSFLEGPPASAPPSDG